jgi:site-specific recombinase XerC
MGYGDGARHFAEWLQRAEIAVGDVDQGVIARFARHRCTGSGCRQHRHLSAKYLRRVHRFVRFLVDRGVAKASAPNPSALGNERIVEFQDWLRHHRGISERTVDRHGRMVAKLLPGLVVSVDRCRSTVPMASNDIDCAEGDLRVRGKGRREARLPLLVRLGLRGGDILSLRLDARDEFVRVDRALAWAAQAPSPPQRHNWLLTLRCFALAMQAEDARHEVPAADALGHGRFERKRPSDRTVLTA